MAGTSYRRRAASRGGHYCLRPWQKKKIARRRPPRKRSHEDVQFSAFVGVRCFILETFYALLGGTVVSAFLTPSTAVSIFEAPFSCVVCHVFARSIVFPPGQAGG